MTNIPERPTLWQQFGCWLYERWKTELVLAAPTLAKAVGWDWLDLRNRGEQLSPDPVSRGRICNWTDSSVLQVSKIFPRVSSRLLTLCSESWEFRLNFTDALPAHEAPQISVLIPFAGEDRFPLLGVTLASLRAQTDVSFEVIVVEQSARPKFENKLPQGVVYHHLQTSDVQEGFNKSWAINHAAKVARGEYLVVHDGDYLAPIHYLRACREILRVRQVSRPARLIFYLDEGTTRTISEQQPETLDQANLAIEKVVQNNPTPIAISKSGYWEIGGHDERYFGWGGEDTEFIDRARSLSCAEGGVLPLLHLWHPSAPKKASGDRNKDVHEQIMSLPAEARIRELTGFEVGSSRPQCYEV